MRTSTLLASLLLAAAPAAVARADVFSAHRLASDAPVPRGASVVVLVHGYDPTPGELDPLAAELRARGHSVVRFAYDWRQDLDRSADELVLALQALRAELALPRLKVVAHSMGGVVARRAMTVGRAPTLAGDVPIELVTLASPFGGYVSANGTYLMPWNALGVHGSHRSLRSWSRFIRHPGHLGANVSHVKVETDEPGRTRVGPRGRVVRDVVARPHNQRNERVDRDPRLVRRVRLPLGHVAGLWDAGRASPLFLAVLDAHGFGPVTPAARGVVDRLGD